MDLLSSLVNVGLAVVLIVNLMAISRLRQTLNILEHKVGSHPHAHAHPHAAGHEHPQHAPVATAASQAAAAQEPEDSEELQLIIAAAVAATLKHDNFIVREVRRIAAPTPSSEWAREGRAANYAARAVLAARPARA